MKSALKTSKKRSESGRAQAIAWILSRLKSANEIITRGENVTLTCANLILDSLAAIPLLERRVITALDKLDLSRVRSCSCGLIFWAAPSTRRTCSVKCAARERQARKRHKAMNGSYSVSIVAVRGLTGTVIQ